MKAAFRYISKHRTITVVTIWAICYLALILMLPHAWVDTVQTFLFKTRVPFEHSQPFGTEVRKSRLSEKLLPEGDVG